jgi:hypothetical protein
MTVLSQNIKNGQQLQLSAGAGQIRSGDLLEIGGPGNEAWTVGVADYAANAANGNLVAQTQIVAAAMAGSTRQPVVRDRLGNLYVVGTNSSGNLVVYKYTSGGILINSAVLDAIATSVNSPHVFQLQSGAYACVYARAAGALYFVVFDAILSIVAGPVLVGTEYASTNVVYHGASPLSGGGFAVVFQSAAGTALNLVTYSNAGAVVQASINVQTLAGTPAQQFLKLGQLSTGNLVCAYRGTMTAGGTAGTSVTVFSVAGLAVAGPTNVDSTATAGLLEFSIMTNAFAVAVANGTNLLCSVLSNVAVAQGSQFSTGNTLNSITAPQTRLLNDGVQFWLAYLSSTANGLYVVQIPATGGSGPSASAMGGGTLSSINFALDAELINGLIVALAASTITVGQFWMSVGLPDASLSIGAPYLRSPPAAFGTAAATTGARWPRVLSAGAGLYTGANPPAGQPLNPPQAGDWTAIFVYDRVNPASTFIGLQKVEASAIIGFALGAVPAGNPGAPLTVNPGPGEYTINPVGGSGGVTFNHVGVAPVAGTGGAVYSAGVALSGLVNAAAAVNPAGSNGNVQLNNSGKFGADATLSFNFLTKILSALGFAGNVTGNLTGNWNGLVSPGITLAGGNAIFKFGGFGIQMFQINNIPANSGATVSLPVPFTSGGSGVTFAFNSDTTGAVENGPSFINTLSPTQVFFKNNTNMTVSVECIAIGPLV